MKKAARESVLTKTKVFCLVVLYVFLMQLCAFPQSLIVMADTENSRLTPLDFSMLQDKSGQFVFPGTHWGMSLSELEKSLSVTLVPMHAPNEVKSDQVVHTIMQTFTISETDQPLNKILDNYGRPDFQFVNDKLVSVDITFLTNQNGMKNNDLNPLYSELKERLSEQFGDCAAINPSDTTESMSIRESCKWMSDTMQSDVRTAIQIAKFGSVGNVEIVTITLIRFGVPE